MSDAPPPTYEELYAAAVRAVECGPAIDALAALVDRITGQDERPRPPHNATVYQQYEANRPEDHVATKRRTGLACLVCNCGVTYGWRPLAEVMAVAAEHRIELD